jgi:sugar/nucleoside kinase (ribokinase family)
MTPTITPDALFVGLCTLDVIQSVDRVPASNEKITARRQTVAAGGPATNASVTFSHLGGGATLLTGAGKHPLTAGIRADLGDARVHLIDLAANRQEPPTVSSIMVTADSGERAVVSTHAVGQHLEPPANVSELVSNNHAVHIDGHHPRLAEAAVAVARRLGRLTVLDGGSWKPGTEKLLPYLDVAVCSANFHPPGTATTEETLAYLRAQGVTWTAVTDGADPIAWQGSGGVRSLRVPQTQVVDTLGAGDIFHGALTFMLSRYEELTEQTFVSALEFASSIATTACGSFGTRTWMTG